MEYFERGRLRPGQPGQSFCRVPSWAQAEHMVMSTPEAELWERPACFGRSPLKGLFKRKTDRK